MVEALHEFELLDISFSSFPTRRDWVFRLIPHLSFFLPPTSLLLLNHIVWGIFLTALSNPIVLSCEEVLST